MGFSPFGKVLGNGMDVVDQIFSGHGESPDQVGGLAPLQAHAHAHAHVTCTCTCWLLHPWQPDQPQAQAQTETEPEP